MQLDLAQAALASAELDLGYTTIYSPVNGIVVSRNGDVGQTLAAAFQTPILFLNILMVSDTERTREIGLRMAVGATRTHILLQFLMEALIMTAIGWTLGVGIGIWIPRLLTTMIGWPTIINIQAVLAAFLFSLVVGLLFGLYPANNASKLNPIETLRYE